MPVAVGGGDADVGCRRNRRDRDQHPDERARLRRAQRQHPRHARASGDEEREEVGAGDHVRQAVTALGELAWGQACDPESVRGEIDRRDREQKARRERDERARRQVAPALHESHAEAGDRPELGADDHRADDQDRGVQEDSDRRDQTSQHDERQVCAGQLHLLARARLDLFPDNRIGLRAARPRDGALGEQRDLGLDRLQRDRAGPVDVELLEVRQRDAGVLARDVREDHVPRGLLRGAGKPDHVTDRPALAQHFERPLRDLSGGDDPHVDHRRSVSCGEPRSARAAHAHRRGHRATLCSTAHRERRSPRPHEAASQGMAQGPRRHLRRAR